MTWYTDTVKDYWLERIEKEGSHFNPDCGNRHYGYQAAPFIWLLDIHDEHLEYSRMEKEFQLPRWILEFIGCYMHDYHSDTSAVFLKEIFEAIPTYTDLETIRHKFMLEILNIAIMEAGHLVPYYQTSLRAHRYSAAQAIAPAVSEHLMCLHNPRRKFDKDYAMSGTKGYLEGILVGFNDKQGFIEDMIECCAEGWTQHAINYMLIGLDQVGKLPDKDNEYKWGCKN